jgi:hypothetical protein
MFQRLRAGHKISCLEWGEFLEFLGVPPRFLCPLWFKLFVPGNFLWATGFRYARWL